MVRHQSHLCFIGSLEKNCKCLENLISHLGESRPTLSISLLLSSPIEDSTAVGYHSSMLLQPPIPEVPPVDLCYPWNFYSSNAPRSLIASMLSNDLMCTHGRRFPNAFTACIEFISPNVLNPQVPQLSPMQSSPHPIQTLSVTQINRIHRKTNETTIYPMYPNL